MKKLTIFGTATCQPCHTLRSALDKAGVKYEYIELADDYSGEITSVPCSVISVDGVDVASVFGNQIQHIIEFMRT